MININVNSAFNILSYIFSQTKHIIKKICSSMEKLWWNGEFVYGRYHNVVHPSPMLSINIIFELSMTKNIKIMLVFKFKQQYMSNFDCCFHANVFFVQLKNLYSYFHFDIMIMVINRKKQTNATLIAIIIKLPIILKLIWR